MDSCGLDRGATEVSVTDGEYVCCFSGHRPGSLPWHTDEADERCLALKRRIREELDELLRSGCRHYLCGMALGCDTYFAEAVLEIKQARPDVILEAVIPCGSQPERWSRSNRLRYNAILDRCDKVTVLQTHYTPDCMMRRNKHMVDASSLLLCCFAGTPGGTMNTILYAERNGLEVRIIEV